MSDDIVSNQQLPFPWNKIVSRGLLKYFCGPCPVCSAEATEAEQLVWPEIRASDTGASYRILCPHDDHYHTKSVGWYSGSPAAPIIDWNLRLWPETRYDFRSEKRGISDAEAMEHYAIQVVKGEQHPEYEVLKSIESEVLWLQRNRRNAEKLENLVQAERRCAELGIPVPSNLKRKAELAGLDLEAAMENLTEKANREGMKQVQLKNASSGELYSLSTPEPLDCNGFERPSPPYSMGAVIEKQACSICGDQKGTCGHLSGRMASQHPNQANTPKCVDWDILAKQYGLEGTELAHFYCLDDEHKKQFLLKLAQATNHSGAARASVLNKGATVEKQAKQDKTEKPQYVRDPKDVRVCINDVEVTEWLDPNADVRWVSCYLCDLELRDRNAVCKVIPEPPRIGQKIQIYDRVIPLGDVPSWEGVLKEVGIEIGFYSCRGLAKDVQAYRLEQIDRQLPIAENLGQIYQSLSKLDQSPWSFNCTPNQLAGSMQISPGGKLLLELPGSGDDVLILYLPDRMTGKPEPVLRCKRWGELEVVAKWHNKLNELAQAFWRAAAHVHHALPLPVSDKQEAILAFCNKHHMTLAEFDQHYYARPRPYSENVMPSTAVFCGRWIIEKA